LVFFLFLPSVTPAPPWSIKGRAGHPTKGTDRFDTQHTTKQQLSSWRPFDLSIRDLGLVPLSTVCTPYYEPFSVLITRAAANWAKISLSFSLFFFGTKRGREPQLLVLSLCSPKIKGLGAIFTLQPENICQLLYVLLPM